MGYPNTTRASTFQCERLHVPKGLTNEVSKNLSCGLWLTPTRRLHQMLVIVRGSWKFLRALFGNDLIVCYKFWFPCPGRSKSLERNSLEKTIPSTVISFMGSIQLSGTEEKELSGGTDVLPLEDEKAGGLLSLLTRRASSWNNGGLFGPEFWLGRKY